MARLSAIDDAVSYRREVAAEQRRAHFKAVQDVRMKPIRAWARKVEITTPGRVRETLLALVNLCASDKQNQRSRWACEPRILSLAKRLKISDRAVKKHTKALVDDGVVIRVLIPGRKRTRGQSCYRFYLCIFGVDAAWREAERDGLLRPKTRSDTGSFEQLDGEPDGELSSPVLGRVFHTLTHKPQHSHGTSFQTNSAENKANIIPFTTEDGSEYGYSREDRFDGRNPSPKPTLARNDLVPMPKKVLGEQCVVERLPVALFYRGHLNHPLNQRSAVPPTKNPIIPANGRTPSRNAGSSKLMIDRATPTAMAHTPMNAKRCRMKSLIALILALAARNA